MDGIFLFFVGLIIFVILSLLFTLCLPAQSSAKPAPKVPGLDFIPTQMYLGADGMGGLAINEQTYQICLLQQASTPPRLFSVKDLMGAFLVLNGEMLGQGLRTKPLHIRRFAQSLTLQVDSLIRQLCPHPPSTRRSNQRIDLIVAVHDQNHCLHVVNFLDMDTKEGGILYEKALGTAKHWHSLLDGLILKADHFEHLQGDIRDSGPQPSSNPTGTELDQLTELVNKQLITRQEFEVQKERIMAGKT